MAKFEEALNNCKWKYITKKNGQPGNLMRCGCCNKFLNYSKAVKFQSAFSYIIVCYHCGEKLD